MYITTSRRPLCKPGSFLPETVIPDFKFGKPFSFIANASDKSAWTPGRLASERKIFRFGKMAYVTLLLTTANFEQVLLLIEEWHEAKIHVHLKFPTTHQRPLVGDHVDPTFVGLDTEECYLPGNKGFEPTKALKRIFRQSFRGDRMITMQS